MFAPSTLILLLFVLAVVQAKVQFLGVGIAGGEFGCSKNGTCSTAAAKPPLSSLGGGDGQGQMRHFVQNDGVNLFRIPVSWQFLVNNKFGGPLDSTNLDQYDQVVQSCLATGVHCMIDIHNFARWNGAVIGQGGPSDDDFASLWSQLAAKYATNEKIVFGLMNEPHDLDVKMWAQTCQKAVTAIRKAGATSQMILLPGTNFGSAATVVSSGSAEALMAIRNPDGSSDKLLLDIHKYLDSDDSGTNVRCTTDNVDSFSLVAGYLRQIGRKGFVSGTGASLDASCLGAFCAQNDFINKNSDVFVGLVGWGAGSFPVDHSMSLTPTKNGDVFVDNALMSKCMVDIWTGARSVPLSSSASSSAPSTMLGATTAPASTAITRSSISSSSPSASTTWRKSLTLTIPLSPTTTTGVQVITTHLNGSPGGSSGVPVVMSSSTMVLGRLGDDTEDKNAYPTTLLKAQGTPTKDPYAGLATPASGGNSTLKGKLGGGAGAGATTEQPLNVNRALGMHARPGTSTLVALAVAITVLL